MNETTQFLGALPDLRTPDEKSKDFKHEERGFATATPIVWKEIDLNNLKKLPIKRQYYTGECVAQSTTKHLGKNNMIETGSYADLSAEFFYYWRINKNTGNPSGMGWVDAMNIAINKASCNNNRIDQRIRESEPEPIITFTMIEEAKKYVGKAYFDLEDITMDKIAEIIERQGSILLWFYFDANGVEWWQERPTVKFPTLGVYDDKATRHALYNDIYGLINGKKVALIDDSAGNDSAIQNQFRIIDEAFLKKRCFKAGYVIDKANLPEPDIMKPVVNLAKNLKVGMTNADVKKLQRVLMYEKLLLIEEPTNNFRGLTLKAVIDFQKKYKLTPDGIVGPITRAFINNKYK